MAAIDSDHDRVPGAPDQNPTVTLTDALQGLRLQGALFLHGLYTEAWAYRSAPAEDIAAMWASGAKKLILFHLVSEGRCWIRIGEGERHWASAGDVIVLPYGDVHEMGGSTDAEVVNLASILSPPPWDDMPYVEHGAGGEHTHVICGYMTSDAALFDPRIRALPPVFVVTPTEPAAGWVRSSIDFASGQIAKEAGGTFRVPTVLPELLLTEVLKIHLASAPAAEQGFVRALNDPVVGAAMARIHADPATKWTVAELAALGNVSASLLDERFRSELGMPPIRYLTAWRMHRAQDLLSTSDLGVAAIARRVGYDSEEAFSRAFKRLHGTPPSVWRAG